MGPATSQTKSVFNSARSVAASYKPPMLVTWVRLPACAVFVHHQDEGEPWTGDNQASGRTKNTSQGGTAEVRTRLLRLLSQRDMKSCRDPGSNRGPSDLRSDALPTELSRLENFASRKNLEGVEAQDQNAEKTHPGNSTHPNTPR